MSATVADNMTVNANFERQMNYADFDQSKPSYSQYEGDVNRAIHQNAKEPDERHILAERFKTKYCKAFLNNQICRYEDRCMFAHGEHELRTAEMNLRDSLFTEEAIKAYQRALRLIVRSRGSLDSVCTRSQLGPMATTGCYSEYSRKEYYGHHQPSTSSTTVYPDDATMSPENSEDANLSDDLLHRRSSNQRRRYRNRSIKKSAEKALIAKSTELDAGCNVECASVDEYCESFPDTFDEEFTDTTSLNEANDYASFSTCEHESDSYCQPTGVYYHNPYSLECPFVECDLRKNAAITISKDSALLYAP